MTRLLRCSVSVIAFVLAGGSSEQATTPASLPAFEPGKGPVVAIDEAHKNTHTAASPSLRGLVELLRGDGYRVKPFAEAMTEDSLSGVSILVIGGPGGWEGPEASLGDREVSHLLEWLRSGGSLLLMLDHQPAPANAAKLTAALGVPSWHDGYAMVEMPDSARVGNIIFWRSESLPANAPVIGPTGPSGGTSYQGADAVLSRHAVTEGRASDERVQRVATFVGSAFRAPSGADALLTMPRRAISLVPSATTGTLPVFTADTPRAPVGGWIQGAVMKVEKGRVALFGETGLFSGGPAADNRQFALNVFRWLSGIL